ncbi:MAG: ABC transporter ATP-binding protein [Oscillospiraceae bacterium]|jgi:oligopeptide transport system ATP-binding protein|nr:ABC transporter ATP-binding protein [Oscillospiraceae bacterium]
MDDTILSIQNLAIEFQTSSGTVKAIRGVDLRLRRGETLAIVGESGSGKSVTVKAVMGILSGNGRVTSGSIEFRAAQGEAVEKLDLLNMPRKARRSAVNGKRIAMVFQDPMTSLNPVLSIGSQLTEGMRLHLKLSKMEARSRAIELLNLVGIPEPEKRIKNYPHQLSGGMRQRVVIAIALACGPDILICDEPTTALDVTIQARILELIQSLQRKMGLSVLYITHDLGVVAKVADTVAVMYAGKIVERGTVNDIFYDARHPYTWGLLSAMPDLETSGDELYTIPGTPPNMLGEIQGDAFAARNRFALNIDNRVEPPMFRVSDTHEAATWLLHENAPRLQMPPALRERIERMRKENNAS